MIFSEQKVAQMAAYFLQKRGGRMAYLKLMKLLYLADRESMDRYSAPMSHDTHVSMPQGPVLSATYNLITGQIQSPVWRSWVASEANYEVSLTRDASNLDLLDDLSDADLEIMDHVWEQFGHMNRWDLVQFTHDHLPEWIDPRGSSSPINPRAVFRALGKNEQQAELLTRELFERKSLGRAVSELI
ncbi:Panacea domain-containing protein [Pseudomonas sp. TNT2022 ID357]|uniref:Panacea domain-containing protein n=1 Tax=Pseudomonas idahonensis TaxID=2942628 RepID=A0ABT5Q836_9PSED|nr:Panacea domain-containing protein [Pseudomonas idahonensis]MDD1150364.1 Panacea domain-containing protein [Pseudomonas idahonensis]